MYSGILSTTLKPAIWSRLVQAPCRWDGYDVIQPGQHGGRICSGLLWLEEQDGSVPAVA